MKKTGIIRLVDDLGRIIIPKDIRRQTGIKEGTPLEIFVSEDGNGIHLRMYDSKTRVIDQANYLVELAEELRNDFSQDQVEKITMHAQVIKTLLQEMEL